MTTLFLARHGQTVWHRENRFAGSSDIALNAAGEVQACALADWAAAQTIEAVIASPLIRARDTAWPVAARLGLPLATDARLRESDFGAAEGLTMAELRARDPEVIDALGPGYHRFTKAIHAEAVAINRQRAGTVTRSASPVGDVLEAYAPILVELESGP